MEPRPEPSLTPNRDDGPFSPGDLVTYANPIPKPTRWYRNWLEEAGQGVILGCRERGHRGSGYWFCTVQSHPISSYSGSPVTKRGSYKAATLKLLRSVTSMRSGWQLPPVSAIEALRASEV